MVDVKQILRLKARRVGGDLHVSIDKGLDGAQCIMLLILSASQPGHHSVHLLHHPHTIQNNNLRLLPIAILLVMTDKEEG